MTWVQRMTFFSFTALLVSMHQVNRAAAINGSQLIKPAVRELQESTSCSRMKNTFRNTVF